MKTKVMFMAVAKAMTMIPSIKNRAVKLENDVQGVAMCSILHANTPGDNNADIGIKLAEAMAGRKGHSSLIVYLCTHGNFAYADKNLSFDRKDTVVSNPEQLFEILSASKWTQAVAEPDPEAMLEAGKQMKSLINRIKKLVKEGKTDKVNFGSDDVFATQLMQAVKGVVVDGEEFGVEITPVTPAQ